MHCIYLKAGGCPKRVLIQRIVLKRGFNPIWTCKDTLSNDSLPLCFNQKLHLVESECLLQRELFYSFFRQYMLFSTSIAAIVVPIVDFR